MSGKVVFLDGGKPVGDFRASVRAVGLSDDLLGKPHDERDFEAAGGNFEFIDLDDWSYVIEVSAQGYVPARSQGFTMRAGQGPSDLHIALGHGASISGHLVDNQTGEPIVGALVQTVDNSDWNVGFTDISALKPFPRATTAAQARTDEDGAFTLDKLSNATYALQFDHSDYPREYTRDIKVLGEELTDVKTVRLPHGATVEGIVYGPDGAPQADAIIFLSGVHIYPHDIRTDEKGHYVLKNIYAGTYSLSASRPSSSHPDGPFGSIIDVKESEVPLTVQPDERTTQNLYLPDSQRSSNDVERANADEAELRFSR